MELYFSLSQSIYWFYLPCPALTSTNSYRNLHSRNLKPFIFGARVNLPKFRLTTLGALTMAAGSTPVTLLMLSCKLNQRVVGHSVVSVFLFGRESLCRSISKLNISLFSVTATATVQRMAWKISWSTTVEPSASSASGSLWRAKPRLAPPFSEKSALPSPGSRWHEPSKRWSKNPN